MKRTLLGLIGAGSLLLLVSQFLPLYSTHVPVFRAAVATRSVGADDAYGLVPITLLAAAVGWMMVTRGGPRYLLLVIGALALAALGITLGRGLVDARASGLRLVDGHYLQAANSVAAGLYVELLGIFLLLGAVAAGLLFGQSVFGPAPVTRPAAPRSRRSLPLRRVR